MATDLAQRRGERSRVVVPPSEADLLGMIGSGSLSPPPLPPTPLYPPHQGLAGPSLASPVIPPGGLAGPSTVFRPPDIFSPGQLIPLDVKTRGTKVLQNLLDAPVAGGALRVAGAALNTGSDFLSGIVNENFARQAAASEARGRYIAATDPAERQRLRDEWLRISTENAVQAAAGSLGGLERQGARFIARAVPGAGGKVFEIFDNVLKKPTAQAFDSAAKAEAAAASRNAAVAPGAATNEAVAAAKGAPVAAGTGAALKPGSSAAEVAAKNAVDRLHAAEDAYSAKFHVPGVAVDENARRIASGEIDQLRAVADRTAREAGQTPATAAALPSGNLEARMAARAGKGASGEQSALTKLSDEQLNAVRTTPGLPPATKAAVDAEVAARVNKGMGITPEAQITSALRQIPTGVSDTVRRAIRGEGQLPVEELAQHLDDALTKAKVPLTDANRIALADKLMGAQVARNKAAAAAAEARAGASKTNAPAPEIPPAKPPPGVPPEEIPQPVIRKRGPLGEVVDFTKTVKTILDVSQLFRQGLWAMVSNALSTSSVRRVIARNAIRDAFRGYSRGYAVKTWQKAQADPLFDTWKKSGGIERDVAGSASRPGSTVEYFQSPFAEKVPILGTAVRGAESSFALTLNSLSFFSWKEAMEARGIIKGAVSEAEQKAFARYFNQTIGNAQGARAEAAARALNDIFFAPSFAIARIQLPYEVLTAKALREGMPHLFARQATDLVKVVAAGVGVLMAAKQAGFEVGISPTGTDFGKIKVGDTTVDIWGGFQQPAVVVARLMLDAYTSSKGTTTSLSGATGVQSGAFDVAGRFVESKLGPTPGTIWALLKGKDYVGQSFGPRGGQNLADTLKAVFGQVAIPLSVADIVQAIQADVESGTSKSRGLPPGTLGAAAGATSFIGFGTSTKMLTKEQRAVEDLRGKYYAAPAFSIGNPGEWSAVYRALQQYRTLKGKKTVAQARADPKLREFYNSAAGGRLKVYVADSGTVRSQVISKERAALQKDPNFKKLGITLDDIISHLGQ